MNGGGAALRQAGFAQHTTHSGRNAVPKSTAHSSSGDSDGRGPLKENSQSTTSKKDCAGSRAFSFAGGPLCTTTGLLVVLLLAGVSPERLAMNGGGGGGAYFISFFYFLHRTR